VVCIRLLTFHNRIPGIGWSFFGADPEWGEMQAAQLQIELEAALAHHDVKVTSQIQGSIEVVPKKLNKGIMAKNFLKRVLEFRAGRFPEFVLVMGDDPVDDRMFEVGLTIVFSLS
jgi:trehalose 6-phosphate synthase/phosphatase